MVAVVPADSDRSRPEAEIRRSHVNLAPADADPQEHERRRARRMRTAAAAFISEVEELHVAQDDAESRSEPQRNQVASDGATRPDGTKPDGAKRPDGTKGSDGTTLDDASTGRPAPASGSRNAEPGAGPRGGKSVPAKGTRKAPSKRSKSPGVVGQPPNAQPPAAADVRPPVPRDVRPPGDGVAQRPRPSTAAPKRERTEPAPAVRTESRSADTATDVGATRARQPKPDAPAPRALPRSRQDPVLAEEPSHGARAIAFVVQRPQPYVAPGRSALNHWRLIAALSVVGLLAGALLGYLKAPTYTAETRLVVGKTAQLSNLASVPGLDAAGQSLAASYSRLVSTGTVRSSTAKKLGGSIGGGLSASPIPRSPVILVEGSASTPEHAAAIADAGSRALVEAVNALNQEQSASADALLNQYEETDRELLVAQTNLDGLKQQVSGVSGTALDNIQKQINLAQSQVDGLQVKLDALSSAYNGVYNPSKINTQVVQRVGDAEQTGSNRTRMIELGALVGLVAAGLLGLGVAVWLDLQARKHA
jgi:hypothetical protein